MERPPEDADAEEIARFLEDDFWEQVVSEIGEAVKEQSDDGPDDSDE